MNINSESDWKKTTPTIIVKHHDVLSVAHLGELVYVHYDKYNKEPLFLYCSTGYPFSFLKPYAKFANQETIEKIKTINEKIQLLQDEKEQVLKDGWKKSKKVVCEEDVKNLR